MTVSSMASRAGGGLGQRDGLDGRQPAEVVGRHHPAVSVNHNPR